MKRVYRLVTILFVLGYVASCDETGKMRVDRVELKVYRARADGGTGQTKRAQVVLGALNGDAYRSARVLQGGSRRRRGLLRAKGAGSRQGQPGDAEHRSLRLYAAVRRV